MYILEGNIGAGKSTFLNLIAQHLPYVNIAQEPLHNWQKKVYGQSLLANFYQNPQRWSYSLETFAMMCRVKEHLKDQEHPNPHHVIERSIYSGHYCFSLNGYKHGFMSDLEWELYNQWFNFLIPQKCKAPQGFIYLQTDPEVAYKRIKKRNRLAEKKITFAYLQQIHEHHESFLIEKSGILPELKEVPVLVLDCNKEFETDAQELKKHMDAVENFLHITQATKNHSEITAEVF
ncbi:MAG: deoxynucleoside kinase [Candidatus Babeliales bacterium]